MMVSGWSACNGLTEGNIKAYCSLLFPNPSYRSLIYPYPSYPSSAPLSCCTSLSSCMSAPLSLYGFLCKCVSVHVCPCLRIPVSLGTYVGMKLCMCFFLCFGHMYLSLSVFPFIVSPYPCLYLDVAMWWCTADDTQFTPTHWSCRKNEPRKKLGSKGNSL